MVKERFRFLSDFIVRPSVPSIRNAAISLHWTSAMISRRNLGPIVVALVRMR